MPITKDGIAIMISIWRIVKEKHKAKAFDGEGAKQYGGRWNHPGFPVVYCSETLALAALELFVQLDLVSHMPLVAIEALIPEDISIETSVNLPKNWTLYPVPTETQNYGGEWLQSERTAVLKIPSVIIPKEYNYLLNPRHSDFHKIKIKSESIFNYDARMQK